MLRPQHPHIPAAPAHAVPAAVGTPPARRTPPARSAGPRRRWPAGHPYAYAAAALVTLGVFGPYTPQPGIRTEQILVYALLLAGVLLGRRIRVTAVGALLGVLLIVEFLIAAIGGAEATRAATTVASGSVLAGLDNLLLPIAVMSLALMMVGTGADPHRLLRIVCGILIVAMCLNTVLCCISLRYDITPLLSIFWENNATQQSVAERAAQMGRLTGIFNQPAEAGALYSIALLATIYRYRDNTLAFALATAMLTIGGVFSVSKIFLLIGLPLSVWQVVRSFGIVRARLWVLTAAMLLVLGAAQSGLLPPWIGVDYLVRLLRPEGSGTDLVDFYTGGRLGDAPSLRYVADVVLGSSPWFGLGAGGLPAAYDNGWVEALAVAGLAGVLIHTAVIGCLVVAWYTRRSAMDTTTARFAGGVTLVLIGASVGLPVLTANRVATVAWTLIGLLLLAPAADPQTRAAAARRPDGLHRKGSSGTKNMKVVPTPPSTG